MDSPKDDTPIQWRRQEGPCADRECIKIMMEALGLVVGLPPSSDSEASTDHEEALSLSLKMLTMLRLRSVTSL